MAEVLGEPAGLAPKLEVVPPDAPAAPAHVQWLRFRDRFAEAMKSSFYSVEELERSIGQGKTLLFPGQNSAVTAVKAEYGTTSVLQITWAVGELDEIRALLPGVEAVARILGCKEVLIEGRKGWERVMRDEGFNFFSVTLRKEV